MNERLSITSRMALCILIPISTMLFVVWLETFRNDSLSLFPALLLFMLAVFARAWQGSWLAPGAFFAAVWSSYILFSFFGAPDYRLYSAAVWWILCCGIVVFTGSLLGSSYRMDRLVPQQSLLQNKHPYDIKARDLNLVRMGRIIVISSAIGFSGIVVLIHSIGMNVLDLLSLQSLAKMGFQLSYLRYSVNEYRQPILYSILLYGMFIGTLFGGVIFAVSPLRKYRLLAFLPIVVAMVNTVVKTNRGTILFAIILWTSSYFATLVWLNRGRVHLFTPKKLIIATGVSVFFVIIYLILQMAREGVLEGDFLELAYLNFKGAVFGSVFAFSYWFDNSWASSLSPTLGEFTVWSAKFC